MDTDWEAEGAAVVELTDSLQVGWDEGEALLVLVPVLLILVEAEDENDRLVL